MQTFKLVGRLDIEAESLDEALARLDSISADYNLVDDSPESEDALDLADDEYVEDDEEEEENT